VGQCFPLLTVWRLNVFTNKLTFAPNTEAVYVFRKATSLSAMFIMCTFYSVKVAVGINFTLTPMASILSINNIVPVHRIKSPLNLI